MINLSTFLDFKAMEKMYSDTKKRTQENMKKVTTNMTRKVPRIVGKVASKRYSLPASDFYPPIHKVKTDRKTGKKSKVKKAGWVTVHGETLDDLFFTWEGRRLTVQRFKMKPSAVPEKPREPYDITFSVIRGSKQTLRNGGKYRHFVQELKGVTQALYAIEDNRKIAGVAKTLSVPIMIDNQEVRPKIQEEINRELAEQIKKLR